MQPSEQLWCERQRVWEREQQLSWARLKVWERESSKSGASLGWLPSVALSNSTRQQQKQMVIRAEINNSKNNIKQQLFTLFCVQLFSLSGWKNKGSGGDIVSYLFLYLQLLLCASVCSACVCVRCLWFLWGENLANKTHLSTYCTDNNNNINNNN